MARPYIVLSIGAPPRPRISALIDKGVIWINYVGTTGESCQLG
jgi:hypothetical protein